MAKTFDLSVIFRVLDKATGPLRNIGGRFRDLAVRAGELGRRMSALGKSLMIKVTAPIAAIGTLSMKSAMDFNQAMANIATLIPGQTKRLYQLKKEILDLAEKMGKAPVDVAEGTYQMISALSDSEETMGKVEIGAMAARAGITSVADAINLLIAQTGAYGDTSYAAFKKAANLAFQTVKLGVTTFPELAQQMANVVSLAAQLDIKQESLAGMMATLTGKTGDTAAVTTQLVGVMTAILRESPRMEQAVKLLGERFGYSAKSAVQLVKEIGLFETYHQMFELVGRDEKKMTELIGGRAEALKGIFPLMGKLSKDYKYKTGEMFKAIMALLQAWKEQTEGINKVGFAWDQTKVRFRKLAIEVGDVVLPALGKLFKIIKPMFKWFSGLSKGTKTVLFLLAGIAALVGPIMVVLAQIGIAVAALSLVGLPAIAAALLPITIATAGLAATALLIIRNWKPIAVFFVWLAEIMGKALEIYSKIAEKVSKKMPKPIREFFGLIPRLSPEETKKWEAEQKKEIEEFNKAIKEKGFKPKTEGPVPTLPWKWKGKILPEKTSALETPKPKEEKIVIGETPKPKEESSIDRLIAALENAVGGEVTIKVASEEGTRSTIADVKRSGRIKLKLITESYTGPTWGLVPVG